MKKKMISVALIGCLVSSLLTGCMQSEDAVKFNEDGSVKISAVIRVKKDAVDSSEGTTTINGKDPKTFKVTTINGIDYYEDTETKEYKNSNEALAALTKSENDKDKDKESSTALSDVTVNSFSSKTVDVNIPSDNNIKQSMAMISAMGKGKSYVRYSFEFPSNIKETNGEIDKTNSRKVNFDFTATKTYEKMFVTTEDNVKPAPILKAQKIKKIKVKATKNKATIKWSKSKNAKSYIIKYGKIRKGKLVSLKTKRTTKIKFKIKKLKKNTKYKATVYAVGNNNISTGKSIKFKTKKK